MAETVHLFLTLNGEDVEGESSVASLGRENSIECYQFTYQVKSPRDPASGQATGKRQHDPIVIVKRIDKSSPRLIKGLTRNEVAAGILKFYRPDPADGATEQFYTIEFKEGRVAGVREFVLDILDPAMATRPPLEEITFTFRSISWTHGNVSHEDTVGR